MKTTLTLALGVLLGAGSAIAAAHLWPRTRMSPELFSANELRFGVAENGRTALCDSDMQAYVPSSGGAGVAYLTEERLPDPVPAIPFSRTIVALKCVVADPPPRPQEAAAR